MTKQIAYRPSLFSRTRLFSRAGLFSQTNQPPQSGRPHLPVGYDAPDAAMHVPGV